jgi:hypothetical protein
MPPKAATRSDPASTALAAANAVDDVVDDEIKKALRLECRELEKKIQMED